MPPFLSLTLAVGPTFNGLGNNEPTAAYLARLVEAINQLPINTFVALPEPAQQWFDTAADALAAGLPVPEPEGFDRALARRPPPVSDGAGAGPRLVIRRPSGAIAGPLTPGPSPPRRPAIDYDFPDPDAPDAPIMVRIYRIVINQPTLSLDAVVAEAARQRITARRATIAELRSRVLNILRFMREAGWKPPQ